MPGNWIIGTAARQHRGAIPRLGPLGLALLWPLPFPGAEWLLQHGKMWLKAHEEGMDAILQSCLLNKMHSAVHWSRLATCEFPPVFVSSRAARHRF